MIIRKPRLIEMDRQLLLESEIISSKTDQLLPAFLKYQIPADYKSFINLSPEPFIIGLLALAMRLKENIQYEGMISRQLKEGIHRYQKILHTWCPKTFHLINLEGNTRTGIRKESARNKLVAFSGGADSFFTLLKNEQITHAVFVHGFDIQFEDLINYEIIHDHYKKQLRHISKDVIGMKTNIRQFYNDMDWNMVHGAALISALHALSTGTSQAFVPASHTNTQKGLFPWGSHPKLDRLLSTENFVVIHDGLKTDRVEKLRFISKYPLTYDSLRVCWEKINGINNCGECDKCVRTMTMLEITGTLKKFKTFKKPLTRKKVRGLKFNALNKKLFQKQMERAALKEQRYDIYADLKVASLKTQFVRLIR